MTVRSSYDTFHDQENLGIAFFLNILDLGALKS